MDAESYRDRRTVAAIQKEVVKQGKRSVVSRLLHAKNDKDKIASWKQDLLAVLQVFNVRSVSFFGIRPLNDDLTDRVGDRYPRDGHGHP